MANVTAPATTVRFGNFEIDLRAGLLRKLGLKVRVPEQSFQVLAVLLQHAGEVVSREELRRHLWPENVFVDFDANLNTAIARLREALNDSTEHPQFIQTLPKRGYRFIGRVFAQSVAAAQAPGQRPRLVVLPFVNLSGDPAQEFFSDAMTDEIITALASLAPEQFGVVARTTAMHYKGSRRCRILLLPPVHSTTLAAGLAPSVSDALPSHHCTSLGGFWGYPHVHGRGNSGKDGNSRFARKRGYSAHNWLWRRFIA